MGRIIVLSKSFLFLVLVFSQINAMGRNPDKETLISQADSLLKVENYEHALEKWNQLVQLNDLTEAEGHLLQSKLQYTDGLRKSSDSNYSEAAGSFAEATGYALKLIPDDNADYLKDLYTSYYHALAYSGNWRKALRVCAEGYDHFYVYLKGKSKADYVYDLGYLNDKLGNAAEAIQLYETSIQELKKLDEINNFDIGLAYNNLSTNYKALGFFSARLNSLEKAQKYWETDAENIDSDYFITLYGNLLKVYLEYGDIEMAEKMLSKTDAALQKHGLVSVAEIINQHRLHIILLTARNELEKAENRLNDLYTFYTSLNEQVRREYHAHLLAGIQSVVDLQVDLNQTESSEYYLRLGLKIARDFDNNYYQMALNSEYSKITDLTGQPSSVTIDYLNRALAINEKTSIGQENLMTLHLRKAHYYDLGFKPDSAKKHILIAFKTLETFDGNNLLELNKSHFDQQNSIYIIRSLTNAAKLHLSFHSKQGDLNEVEIAFHLYDLAAKIFEGYYRKGAYNASLHHINREIKEGIFTVLHRLEQPLTADLLELIEQNNSQTLRKEFEAKQQKYTLLPPELLNERNVHIAQLASLNNAVEAHPDSLELSVKRKEVQKNIEILSAEINSIDPQFAKLHGAALTISALQEGLTDQELIVQYVQGDKASFAVLVSREDIQLFSLGYRLRIDSLVAEFHQSIQTLGSGYEKFSEACYQFLMLPFQEELKKYDNLIIVPDGKLNYLAFESLRPDQRDKYLVQTHSISYSPSLSLWNLTRSVGKQSGASERKSIAAFAPVYTEGYYENGRPPAERAGSGGSENRLEDIQGATREAEMIAERFEGDFYTRDEASKTKFIAQTNNYDVYHLAMHTIYDDMQSKNSQLVFQNDEKLSFNELYALHFPAKMVVLSACNTGIGELKAGEGMQSLSQALSYSGVQSSVYSLWPVPDKETAEIMLLFYENLKSGLSKGKALAEAKRVFIANNPLHTHPYFWAGFVLQGNADPIIEQPLSWIYWVGSGLLILIVLVWIVLKKGYSRSLNNSLAE